MSVMAGFQKLLRLLLGAVAAIVSAQGAQAFPARVEVSTRGLGFTVAGRPFVPLGVNDIVQHTGAPYKTFNMFDPRSFDPGSTSRRFRDISAAGFGFVRLWLKGLEPDRGFGLGPNQISDAYVDEIVQTLRLARQNNLYVVLTGAFKQGVWLPANYGPDPGRQSEDEIGGMNRLLLVPGMAEGLGRFYADLLRAIAHRDRSLLDAIFYLDLYNEIGFDLNEPPFSRTSGDFTYEGKRYSLADAAQRQALMDEAAHRWFATLQAGVRPAAPHVLLTASSFLAASFGHKAFDGGARTLEPPHRSPYPLRPSAIRTAGADLLDVHIYPSAVEIAGHGFHDRLPQLLAANEIEKRSSAALPLVAGEFGAMRSHFSDVGVATQELRATLPQLCGSGFSGFAVWMWSGPGDTWTLEDSTLAGALEPALDPEATRCFARAATSSSGPGDKAVH